MKKLYAFLLLTGCYTSAFAMLCPNNFNQINIGDSIAQVTQECGKPDEQSTSKEDSNGPQAWSYYVNPTSRSYMGPAVGQNSQQASVKMDIAFNKGKVINVTVNSMSLASTTLCGASVSVGDTLASVKKACGDPSFINKSTSSDSKPVEKTVFKYNSTPPVSLVFEDGKLTDRQ